MSHEPTGADFGTHADTAEVSVALPDPGGAEQVASRQRRRAVSLPGRSLN